MSFGRSEALFGVEAKRLSRPWISVTRSWRERAARRFRRSSRWAAFIEAVGLLGFVWSSRFLRFTPVGALLKLTCGFLLTLACILPPGHDASASFAFCEMQASAAVAAGGLAAPATTATASAPSERRIQRCQLEFDP